MKKSTVFASIALVVILAIIGYALYSVNYVQEMTKSGPCNKAGVDNAVAVFNKINEESIGIMNQNTENMKNGVSSDYTSLTAQFENEEKYFGQIPVPACLDDWKSIQAKSFHEITLAYDAYNHGSVTKFSEHLDMSGVYGEQASDELKRILACYPFCK